MYGEKELRPTICFTPLPPGVADDNQKGLKAAEYNTQL